MDKLPNPEKFYGWQFLIDGPCKGTWIKITYEFVEEPAMTVEYDTNNGTIARYVRSPKSDFPGPTFCYKFEEELDVAGA